MVSLLAIRRTLFEMFDLEPPSPQETVTTQDREHRGPVEPNQGDHQPRRPIRTRRRPRRLNVEPRRRTYESAIEVFFEKATVIDSAATLKVARESIDYGENK
ncbi:hypothetical protein Tcan_03504 [Toxocara canis]|uniref:Uncharacterized protein n=1 Tax=Toxocara canis TaxID=6265 RepID=A0A0B2VVX6_TOXCA|nr:hypothetical protein Tcan_03504 [Toxocara canis]